MRWRNIHTLNRQRLLCAFLFAALVPAALELPALATLGIVVAVLVTLIAYETRLYGERRDRVRHPASAS
jgi:hypothetical protein